MEWTCKRDANGNYFIHVTNFLYLQLLPHMPSLRNNFNGFYVVDRGGLGFPIPSHVSLADWFQTLHTSLSTMFNNCPPFQECCHPIWMQLIQKNLVKCPPVALTEVPHLKSGISLYEHQHKAVEFILQHPRAILASDMGLGKTLMSLSSALLQNCKNVLIICPASLKKEWNKQISEFFPENVIITTLDKVTPISEGYFLIAYSILEKWLASLSLIKWDMIICDEAHYVKNIRSQRAKAVKSLSKKTHRLLLMTGTPAHTAMDLWGLLHLVDPVMFDQFYTKRPPRHFSDRASKTEINSKLLFGHRWTVPSVMRVSRGKLTYDFRQTQRLEELKALTRCYIFRQKLEECVQLPGVTTSEVVIGKPTKEDLAIFENTFALMNKQVTKHAADVLLHKLVMKTSELKRPLVLKYLLNERKEGLIFFDREPVSPKILVFVYHQEFLEYLVKELSLKHIQHVAIYGETKVKEREKLKQEFQENPQCNLALLSYGVGSTGLNLAFVNRVIYAELTFDANQHKQSLYRCHRIGQTVPVTMQFLIMSNTTDQSMMNSIRSKNKTSHDILEEEQPLQKKHKA
jgi:SWI/SNF-related matrix-associated actin-dependent regulator of chromatin subfamily A-like protein 1